MILKWRLRQNKDTRKNEDNLKMITTSKVETTSKAIKTISQHCVLSFNLSQRVCSISDINSAIENGLHSNFEDLKLLLKPVTKLMTTIVEVPVSSDFINLEQQ